MTIANGSFIEISLAMTWMSQQMYLVYQYQVGTLPLTVNAVQLAEGWWNNVKTVHRALAPSGAPATFRRAIIRELNAPTGDYATFDINPVDQVGTRTGASGDKLPAFNAYGVQLVVGTRATRPGQKRVPFGYEGDQVDGVWSATFNTLILTWANLMTAPMTLGAPAATATIQPIIVRRDASGFVTAHQPITGWLANPNVTTQNSRKPGRGI